MHRLLRKAEIFYRHTRGALSRLCSAPRGEFLPFRHTGSLRAGHLSQISRLWKIRAALIA